MKGLCLMNIIFYQYQVWILVLPLTLTKDINLKLGFIDKECISLKSNITTPKQTTLCCHQ